MIPALRTQSPITQSSAPGTRGRTTASDNGPVDGLSASVEKPAVSKSQLAALTAAGQPEMSAEKKSRLSSLPTWMRVTTAGLGGLIATMALTGCDGKSPAPATPAAAETAAQKSAHQEFNNQLSQLETQMGSMTQGTGQQQNETVTRKVMDLARSYGQKAGKSGDAVVSDLTMALQEHPALTVSTIAALGIAGGIGLEKLGLTDGVHNGAQAVIQAVKDHPYIAAGVAVTAAGGAAYLIHQMVSSEGAIPDKPTGVQAEKLDKTFSGLEEQLAAPNANHKDITQKAMDAVARYQKETGKAWQTVSGDVKAFAYAHPVLAASLIASAGVATGVVLERAGVPAKAADMAATALQGGKDAAGKFGEFVSDHPVASGVVAVAVASGVGYLVYEHFQPSAPAATAPAAVTTQQQ